ncbi:hypothetical protein AMJ57_02845 [Parcubacteria bacterium SG8_24]|nr:MAG: hypothetical protein AMJ57_02845 [Parcubacteria bacterium SG8_24]
MEIPQKEIEHIISLARLELTDEERSSFGGQLSAILEYVGQLSRVDVEEVEPMSHSVTIRNVLRPDEAIPCPDEERQGAVDAFPDEEEGLLKVDSVFS